VATQPLLPQAGALKALLETAQEPVLAPALAAGLETGDPMPIGNPPEFLHWIRPWLCASTTGVEIAGWNPRSGQRLKRGC